MTVEVATLIAGSETPAGDGISGALRCTIRLADGTQRAAVLKRGSSVEVTAELFATLLLRGWSLPVPEPFLVDEGGRTSFATADVGYPNLKQSLGVGALQGAALNAMLAIACKRACSFASAPLAAACDEAIENRDRNLGNILWDGAAVSWIDHGAALGQAVDMDDLNKLCGMAISARIEDPFLRSAVTQGLVAISSAAISDAAGELAAAALSCTTFTAFVAGRLPELARRLEARFPRPSDLLSGL